MSRARTQLLPICTMVLFLSGCSTRMAGRSISESALSYQPLNPTSLSDSVRSLYKASSEASRQAEQRSALLSSNPDLAPLLDQAENNPLNKEARARIVFEYMSRELYWGAYDLLTKALPDNLNDPDVNMSLAVIWDSWGQYGLALQYGERGIASGAASAQAYETMGRILLHQDEPAEALTWYRRSLEFGPGAVLLANIGFAHMLISEWEEARVSLEEALALDDTLVEAHNNLAVVLSRSGDDTGALAHLLRASRPAAAFNNLGVLYLQAKNNRAAQHYFEEALRLEPNYEVAQRNLQALQVMLPPASILHLPAFRSEPKEPASEHQQDLIHQPPVADRRLSRSEESSNVSAGLDHVPLRLGVSVKAAHLQSDQIPEQPGPTARAEKSHQEAALSVIADSNSFPLPKANAADHGIHGRQNVVTQGLSQSLGLAGFAGLIFATGFLALRSRKSSTSTTTKLNQ